MKSGGAKQSKCQRNVFRENENKACKEKIQTIFNFYHVYSLENYQHQKQKTQNRGNISNTNFMNSFI